MRRPTRLEIDLDRRWRLSRRGIFRPDGRDLWRWHRRVGQWRLGQWSRGCLVGQVQAKRHGWLIFTGRGSSPYRFQRLHVLPLCRIQFEPDVQRHPLRPDRRFYWRLRLSCAGTKRLFWRGCRRFGLDGNWEGNLNWSVLCRRHKPVEVGCFRLNWPLHRCSYPLQSEPGSTRRRFRPIHRHIPAIALQFLGNGLVRAGIRNVRRDTHC